MRRTRRPVVYHRRRGFPVIHHAKNGRMYIMVRRSGGGVKRLYENSKYKTNGIVRRLRL